MFIQAGQVQGSVLTNKYTEGYPSKRYYGGCEYANVAEQLAIETGLAQQPQTGVVDLKH